MHYIFERYTKNMGYFKGWYFKCCTNKDTIAFIPAYHRTNGQTTASLQIITDSSAINIPLHSLKHQSKPLFISADDCTFSEKGIKLDIAYNNHSIRGVLSFGRISPIRYDIMGPFSLIPFMQCRHSIHSMSHRIDGHLVIDGCSFIFRNGTGYIEGDCGRSFPKQYLWTQSGFENGSLMLSVADIPMIGRHFTGIIGIIMLGSKEYRIATYLGADIKKIADGIVTVRQSDYQLTAKLIDKNMQPLYAPSNGRMSRTIHESASCKAYYRFLHKGKPLCEFTSDSASFEFEYK